MERDGRGRVGVARELEVVEDADRPCQPVARPQPPRKRSVPELVPRGLGHSLHLEGEHRHRVRRGPRRDRHVLERREPGGKLRRVEGVALDDRVDPVGVALQRLSLTGREGVDLGLPLGARLGIAAGELVHLEVAQSEQLGQPALRRAAQDLHLEQSLLRLGVADPVGEPLLDRLLVGTTREHVRHPTRVAHDRDACLRLGRAGRAGDVARSA